MTPCDADLLPSVEYLKQIVCADHVMIIPIVLVMNSTRRPIRSTKKLEVTATKRFMICRRPLMSS